jgi:uncharacterized membrane protein
LSSLFHPVLILNALFFLFYGVQCLVSDYMIAEFRRFGLPDSQRRLTGVLQILGAAGLLVGLHIPAIGLLSATGLLLMMLAAFGVRMKIKDNFIQSLPSIVFMVVNGYLAVAFLRFFFD